MVIEKALEHLISAQDITLKLQGLSFCLHVLKYPLSGLGRATCQPKETPYKMKGVSAQLIGPWPRAGMGGALPLPGQLQRNLPQEWC